MSLPPLNRLRKGVVFFSLFFLFFVFYRLAFLKASPYSNLQEEDTQKVTTEICLLVGPNGPVNVDTVFSLKMGINKIFAYSYFSPGLNNSDTLWHQWYYGSKLVKETECVIDSNACYSSISTDSLSEGSWSVDVKQGALLLDVKQFEVEGFNGRPPK
jgi:hypothetical protein